MRNSRFAFAKRTSLKKKPAAGKSVLLKKPSASSAVVCKKVASFDFGGNHKYKCEQGGRFSSYYIADDGTIFHGSNKQAHKCGLSWSKHGVYSCCDAVRINTTYTFKLEPSNPYDSNAVKIIGDQTKELVGHVPREWNLLVGGLLRKSQKRAFAVVGKRVACGRMMEIDCFVQGPCNEVAEFDELTDTEAFH